MAPRVKFGIAGVVIALVLLIIGVPWYVPVILIALAVGIPLGAYAMLDPSQRRRVRAARRRKSLGN
jgi:uncharacterized membrane protein